MMVLLAVLPLPEAAVVCGLFFVILLVLHDLIWGVCAAVLSVTVQEVFTLPGGMTLTQTAMMLVVTVATMKFLAFPSHPIRVGRPFFPLTLVVWFYACSAVCTPYSPWEGCKETLRWVFVAVIYLVSINILYHPERPHHPTFAGENVSPLLQPLRSPRWSEGTDRAGWWRIGALVVAILLAAMANALVGLWQFLTADGPESFAIAGGRFVRAYGTIGHPNSFAGYLNMAWPLAFAIAAGAWATLLGQRHRHKNTGNVRTPHHSCGYPAQTTYVLLVASGASVGTLVLWAALFASYSRGGWIGAVGGGIVLLIAYAIVWSRRFTLRKALWILGGMVGGGGVVFILLASSGILPSLVTDRLASIVQNFRLVDIRAVKVTPENFAVVERVAHLQAGLAMFFEHPLTGIGAGNYSLAYEGSAHYPPYAIHPWYTSQGHAHNFYINVAAETGIGGLAAYLLLLTSLFYQAWRTLQHVEHWFTISVAAGCCGILGSVATQNLFEHLHVLHMGIPVAAGWGMLVALEHQHER